MVKIVIDFISEESFFVSRAMSCCIRVYNCIEVVSGSFASTKD